MRIARSARHVGDRHLRYARLEEYKDRVRGDGPHAAPARLRLAQAMDELPAIRSALDCGELSYSAVREISRVAIPATEPGTPAALCPKVEDSGMYSPFASR